MLSAFHWVQSENWPNPHFVHKIYSTILCSYKKANTSKILTDCNIVDDLIVIPLDKRIDQQNVTNSKWLVGLSKVCFSFYALFYYELPQNISLSHFYS